MTWSFNKEPRNVATKSPWRSRGKRAVLDLYFTQMNNIGGRSVKTILVKKVLKLYFCKESNQEIISPKISDEADDWDVDMEGYDVEGGGDLDNQNFMSMDKFNKLESGRLHLSAFKSKKSRQSEPSTGYFERHTKGVGRKLLEKQGTKINQIIF